MFKKFSTYVFISVHLQGPSESIPTQAFSCCFVTGSPGGTLAPLQTSLPEGPRWTGVIAVASYEARRTLTCPLDRIAEGSVLTLTRLTAGWPPVFIITGWKGTGETTIYWLLRHSQTTMRRQGIEIQTLHLLGYACKHVYMICFVILNVFIQNWVRQERF